MSKEKVTIAKTSQKVTLEKKRRHKKTRKSIQKLFNQLRNESANNTVIEIDDTSDISNNTIINKDSLIIIPDDDEDPSRITTPRKNVYCLPSHSTPNPHSKVTLNDMIDANTNNNDITNVTKNINRDSYLTIDLTMDSSARTTQNPTVIDLANATEQDGPLVSYSNTSTMSGDSEVTVINMKEKTKKTEMQTIANGIAKLNASDKGKLLEMITEKIFNGCSVSAELRSSLVNLRKSATQAKETEEDSYIKQVILKQSRNSIGSNIYNPEKPAIKSPLRMIVIDGSNVAMEHSRGRFFSVKGLKICIDYFLSRGHVVKAFVPRFRCKFGKSSEPRLLDHLERQGWVIYTPSREIQGKTITPYDDRYIVQCAAEFDGIIVSDDHYRDLAIENPRWRFVIENRLLPFTWVQDMIMFPRDPLGRNGPSLEMFLRHPNTPPT